MEIAVIGAAGNVGAEVAFLIAQNELTDKLILLDILEDKLRGVALDIEYSCGNKKTKVIAGNYEELNNCEIIIFAAGKPRTAEESRAALLETNSVILDSVLRQINNEKAIFVIVTNPVDLLVSKAVEFGLPKERVVGVSTLHDTLRLKAIMKRVGCEDKQCYVFGKHGEGQYIVKDNSMNLEKIKEEVDGAGKCLINLRGFTSFGVAAATSEMIDAITNNKDSLASIHNHGSVPVTFENFQVRKKA